MNATAIAGQLLACAAKAGNSEHKRALLIDLPSLVMELAHKIAQGTYAPEPFTVFAVTDPKLREIFAPSFADRLVQQWLIEHIESWWNQRFIDDSFANRKGKGVQSAVDRLQHFMRQPGHRWYCKLDIRAFFPSIDRDKTLSLWRAALPRLPYPAQTLRQLDQVATAIFQQSPIDPPPMRSGRQSLLHKVPPHKTLFFAAPGKGMPIGSLTSQFFANVYLNELDQFIKHGLKIKGYLRYVDDFVILSDSPQQLNDWRKAINKFLMSELGLELHSNKTVMQRCTQGVDYLGTVVFPSHRLTRQRSVRAFKRRIAWFNALVFGGPDSIANAMDTGGWQAWLQRHDALVAPGVPSAALLQRMLSTINSYYGVFGHSDTWRLRKHIYEIELGRLRAFFLPDGPRYRHLRIRKVWKSTCIASW